MIIMLLLLLVLPVLRQSLLRLERQFGSAVRSPEFLGGRTLPCLQNGGGRGAWRGGAPSRLRAPAGSGWKTISCTFLCLGFRVKQPFNHQHQAVLSMNVAADPDVPIAVHPDSTWTV